jgi:uncharacterized protein with PQ loop repeat
MEWLGYVAATLTTIAFVPQAFKTIRTRDTRGISLGCSPSASCSGSATVWCSAHGR